MKNTSDRNAKFPTTAPPIAVVSDYSPKCSDFCEQHELPER